MSIKEGLNEDQSQAAETLDGPLLIIAGPGSGKTHTLVRRTLNIIESGLARPEEIVLCTFTEKAALELRDRTRNDAAKFGINQDLSGLVVGTIHGIANDFIQKFRHKTQALSVASPAALAYVTAPSDNAAHPNPIANDLNENFTWQQS